MSLAYRTGTIAVPNGGTTVTGTLTAWVNQAKQGDVTLLPDGNLYEVAATPTVNTTLTIVEPYAGATVASGGAYAIYRFSDGWRPTAEINIRLGTLLDRFESTTGFILNGTGVPSDALGEDGDLFIRTDVPSLYSKESGTWSFAASLGGDPGPAGSSYAATSTTSRTLDTGSMTVTTQTGLAYVAGTRVRLSSAASPTTHYMEGVVTAYDTGTGSLTFTSDLFAGSGSRADWNLSLAGDRGTQGATGAGYAATSTTSLLIGTGTKSFTTQTGLGYTAGQRARASSAANTANFMEGRVASYSGGTLTLTVDVVGGSGTLGDWSINVAGSQGIQGIQGDDGIQGIQGVTGASYAATSTTSLAIGTGAKASTTQTGLAYVSGSRVRMASAANTSNYMEGICTAYNSGTGAITIDVEIVGGSGTYADWNFSLAGNKGDAGDGFSFEDDYNAGTTYSLRDVVLDQNSTWIYINVTPGSGNAPPTLPTAVNAYWKALAVRGADGYGAVNTVNGIPSVAGNVEINASDIAIESLTPVGYTPAGLSIEQHLSGISTALLTSGINANYLVNAEGLFNTNPATSAADTADIVDHWRALTQSNAISFSVLSDVADGVPKMIRLSQANASAQRMGAAQTIEAAAAKLLRGRDVTLSGKVRLSTSATVRFAVLAWTGTADSTPADVIADWTNGTYTAGNFFTSTTMSLVAEGNLAVTANTLTDISLSGSVPSGANNIIVLFWTSATVIQNVTLDFRAKLETGDVGTAWAPLDPALEYARTDDLARRLLMGTATGAALGLITNPFFDISQENGTTAGDAASAYYAADQWFAIESSDAVLSVQNVVNPFSSTSGLRRLLNSIKATATTADASLGASQYVLPASQTIEGIFFKSLGWGAADARAIDIVFIAQCSVTGTYPVAVRNDAANRSYVTTVSLTANTPTVCLVTIPGDTGGTWQTGAVTALQLWIGAASGTDYHASSLNAWEAANRVSHSSCTNWAASGTPEFFQVGYCQVFPAGVLPFTSAAQITGEALQILLNMRRPYDDELRRCQRYCRPWGADTKGIWTGSGTAPRLAEQNTVVMRIAPSATLLSATPTIEHWNIAGYVGSGSSVSANGSNIGSVDLTISGFSSGVANGSPAFSANDIAFLSARM